MQISYLSETLYLWHFHVKRKKKGSSDNNQNSWKEVLIIMKKLFLSVMFFVLIVMPIHAFAGIAPSPFYFSDAPEFENAILRVLFAPQPEPPKVWDGIIGIDTSDPTAPVFTAPNDAAGYFQLTFEIENATVPLIFEPMVNDAEDQIALSIYKQPIGGINQLVYTGVFTFESENIGLALNGNVMFAPQPEPPDDPFLLATISLPEGSAPVSMTMRLMDVAGLPANLTPVPEPATLLLLGLGLMGLAGVRRLKKKVTQSKTNLL